MVRATFLILFVVHLALGFGGKKEPATLDRMVVNPVFDAKKNPNETEPEAKLERANAEWAKTKIQIGDCKTGKVWKTENDANVRITAFKNKEELPVKGIFGTNQVMVSWDPKSKTLIGEGALDLGSYNTGDEVRDHRVKREVLKLEDSSFPTVVSFKFALDNANISQIPLKTDIGLGIEFQGKNYALIVPVDIWIEKGSFRLRSQKDARFDFSAAGYLASGMLRLMERCNHQSIGSFADVGFDVTLPSTCK